MQMPGEKICEENCITFFFKKIIFVLSTLLTGQKLSLNQVWLLGNLSLYWYNFLGNNKEIVQLCPSRMFVQLTDL